MNASVSEKIRVKIDDTGQQLGIMAAPHRLWPSRKQKGLDLVENLTDGPCRRSAAIMDFGKYQYQEAKEGSRSQEASEGHRGQGNQVPGPKSTSTTISFKKKHIERFLEEGDKVKGDDFLQGPRDGRIRRSARRILERLVQELSEVCGRRGHAQTRGQPDAHHFEPTASGREPVENRSLRRRPR